MKTRAVQLGAIFVIILGIAVAVVMPRSGRQIAPVGFDCRQGSAPHGKVETVEYDSKTVGVKRRMLIYTPPGYSPAQKYPVLYLLHGIADDERAWCDRGSADVILDNLFAADKAIPMVLVMPNGCAVPYLEAKSSGEEVSTHLWHLKVNCFEGLRKKSQCRTWKSRDFHAFGVKFTRKPGRNP